jgi:hypothetical protein
MKTIAWVILAVVPVIGSGCARPDWIERTLVTVDVTGTWEGVPDVRRSWIRLKLEQQGSRVTGSLERPGTTDYYCFNAPSGPIAGTLTGDVFNFRQTNGVVAGELTVSGDEMTGDIRNGCGHGVGTLRRTDSAPHPSSPKP